MAISVKPTRMELLLTKKKLKLAEKGHKLLKEKRDVLVMEFFSVLKDIKSLREGLAEKMKSAQDSLNKAEAMQGQLDVERFALGVSPGTSIKMSSKNVMGVIIPQIESIEVEKQWFGYFESTIELDNAISKFRELMPTLLKLCEKQLALQRLAEDIGKTKRKVNSLEYLIMPKLNNIKKLITFKLEELERENFSRLKKIKVKTEAA